MLLLVPIVPPGPPQTATIPTPCLIARVLCLGPLLRAAIGGILSANAGAGARDVIVTATKSFLANRAKFGFYRIFSAKAAIAVANAVAVIASGAFACTPSAKTVIGLRMPIFIFFCCLNDKPADSCMDFSFFIS